MNIILSIHPKWAQKIYSGEKTIEWRKNYPTIRFPGQKVYIYETTPICRVTGYFTLTIPIEIDAKNIRPKIDSVYVEKGCVPPEDLKKYQCKRKAVYGWPVTEPVQFECPKELSDFGLKRPPQSWQYTEV